MASKAYPHCSEFEKHSCFNRGETSWEDYKELLKLIDCKEGSGLGYWEPHSINIVHYLLHLHHWFLIIFIYVSLFECMGTCGYGGHACAWTWKSEEGIGCSNSLLYACTLRKCLFLDLGLEPLMSQQVPGSHPVSVWLWAGITGFYGESSTAWIMSTWTWTLVFKNLAQIFFSYEPSLQSPLHFYCYQILYCMSIYLLFIFYCTPGTW